MKLVDDRKERVTERKKRKNKKKEKRNRRGDGNYRVAVIAIGRGLRVGFSAGEKGNKGGAEGGCGGTWGKCKWVTPLILWTEYLALGFKKGICSILSHKGVQRRGRKKKLKVMLASSPRKSILSMGTKGMKNLGLHSSKGE